MVNKAYDASIVEPAGTQIGKARELFQHLSRELSPISPLPEVDLDVVAEGQFSDQEWAIDQMVPVGTAGLIGGPQERRQDFLELMRMICLITGRPFLNHYAVRPVTAATGYFSEDSKGWLERYVGKICRAFGIDPANSRAACASSRLSALIGSCSAPTATPPKSRQPPGSKEIRDDALAAGARWIAFDHLLRYCAILHNSTPLNFSLFEQLDALSTEIGGNVVVLTHPSKLIMRAGVKGLIAKIGGSACWCRRHVGSNTSTAADDEGGRKIRQFTVEKVSYGERQRFCHPAIVENYDGIVEHYARNGPR